MKEVDIYNVFRRLAIVGTRRVGAPWVVAPCPFSPWKHKQGQDRRPSFGVAIKDGKPSHGWCYSCHWNGSMAKLVQDLEMLRNIRYPDELHRLVGNEQFSGHLPSWDQLVAPDEGSFIEPLSDALFVGAWDCAWDDPAAREYLMHGRPIGLGEEAARSLDLRYDPDERRIVFPVRGLAGELYGFSGRAIDQLASPKVRDYVNLPKRHLILGCHRWQHGRPVVVVEGLFAYAHFVSIGVERFANVGAVLGSVMTEEKAVLLRNFGERVFLVFDPDDAGTTGVWGPVDDNGKRDIRRGAIGKLLGQIPVSIPPYPDGVGDPDLLTLDEVETMLAHHDFFPRGNHLPKRKT